jgi:hypothetical protein
MKNFASRFIFLLSLLFAGTIILSGQVPQGFNYMAIARDGDGNILPDLPLTVRIALLDGDLVKVWEEAHDVTTNGNGLFQIIIGQGKSTEAGYVLSFDEIDWKMPNMSINTSLYLKDEWLDMGTVPLLSVPFSMVSKDVQTPLTISGKSTDFTNPIFEVKNSLNQPVFSVYGDGIRIHVADITTKSPKGGFSVGGFDVKADPVDYLTVTRDYTVVNVNRNAPKGPKGGFSVGGFDGKTDPSFFLNMTSENYFIGEGSGLLIEPTGLYNSVIGYQAGKSLTTGSSNTMLGHLAGTSVSSGGNNILIGEFAGNNLATGQHNTIIGNSAGYNHTTQEYNVMIGTGAGYNLIPKTTSPTNSGSYNNFIGINAGNKIKTGMDNTFVGTNAGAMLEEGNGNTIIGIDAGRGGNWDPGVYHSGFVTSNNTIIGNGAGYSLDVGSGNVFIGYSAGAGETGTVISPADNKLYIANSSSNPLIYGDFSAKRLGINTTTLNETLNVEGNASISGTLTATSINAPITGNLTGNVTGDVTGNVTGSAGNIGGLTMGIINFGGTGNFLTASGGIYVLSVSGGVITVTNNSGTYCALWYQGHQAAPVSGTIIINNPTGSTFNLPAFTAGDPGNGQGIEIHFGKPYGGAYCSVWLSWSNSRLIGHYIMY